MKNNLKAKVMAQFLRHHKGGGFLAHLYEYHAIKKSLNHDISINMTFLGPFGLFSNNLNYSADLAFDVEWAFGLMVKIKEIYE